MRVPQTVSNDMDLLARPLSSPEKQTTCPLCSHADPASPAQKKPDHKAQHTSHPLKDHISGETFQLGQCLTCSHGYIIDPPSIAQIPRYYENPAGLEMHRRSHPIVEKMRAILFTIETRGLCKALTPHSRILELGAGDGSLSRFLKDRGYSVEARDLYPSSQWQHQDIEYRAGHLAHQDGLGEFIKLADKNYPDAIIMRHVLEHLHDPIGVLHSLARCNIPLIYIVVPNQKSIFARIFPDSWYYWDPPRHLHHFSDESLTRTASAGGYNILQRNFYGIDEIFCTFYRFLLVKNIRIFTSVFSPKSILSSLASAAFFAFGKTVCAFVLEKNSPLDPRAVSPQK